jgi:hypothetical protein
MTEQANYREFRMDFESDYDRVPTAKEAWQACAEQKDKDIAEFKTKLDKALELLTIACGYNDYDGNIDGVVMRLTGLHAGTTYWHPLTKDADEVLSLPKQLAELKAENERLAATVKELSWDGALNEAMAYNAMLVEMLQNLGDNLGEAACGASTQKDADVLTHYATDAFNALNATPESIQQWIDKHDAEKARETQRSTLLEAADETNDDSVGTMVSNWLRRMADEVK